MKAAVYTEYGSPDVIQIKELERPTPKPNEVLIRIHATTVASADCRARSLKMPRGFGLLGRLAFGISRPRNPVLGTDFAGEVADVGKDVTQFKKGDRVFGLSGMSFGCHAEYKCLREDAALAHIPSSMSYEEAVTIPFGGTTAVTFLRDKAKVQPGEKVLVVGASGSVGTAAIQIAKHMGAVVTGVCSTTNMELVKSIGADHVIDYTKKDFTQNGETYDVILDTVGHASFANCKNSLTKNGRLLLIAASLPDILTAPLLNMTNTAKVIAGPASERAEDLYFLADLATNGKLKPVMDQKYPLDRIREAYVIADSGRKRGSLVITM